MHKARKDIARILPATDIIVEVLDARIPFSSENPMLQELRGEKPCLKVLAKSDLADQQLTELWLHALTGSNTEALAIEKDDPAAPKRVISAVKSICPRAPGRLKPSVILIVGIPNVGKSTLINVLAGRAAAKTGNEPAITKRQQLIPLSDHWQVRDTPGVLWPNVENVNSGYRLAATGAIRDTAMDSSEVAAHLLDYLAENYADRILKRYGAGPLTESIALLEYIGQQRGCLGAGGLVDFDRAARIVLQDFRSGELGTMTLETPSMKEIELAELATLRQVKLAKKEKRQQRRNK
jgi:ribosome biogenesis GTPase A